MGNEHIQVVIAYNWLVSYFLFESSLGLYLHIIETRRIYDAKRDKLLATDSAFEPDQYRAVCGKWW